MVFLIRCVVRVSPYAGSANQRHIPSGRHKRKHAGNFIKCFWLTDTHEMCAPCLSTNKKGQQNRMLCVCVCGCERSSIKWNIHSAAMVPSLVRLTHFGLLAAVKCALWHFVWRIIHEHDRPQSNCVAPERTLEWMIDKPGAETVAPPLYINEMCGQEWAMSPCDLEGTFLTMFGCWMSVTLFASP